MPGVRWVLAAIYLWYAVMSRAILFHWGVPIPFRLISQIGNTAVVALVVIGVYLYTRRHPIHQVFTAGYCRRMYCWFLLVALLAFYGIARGNDFITIGKELTGFCYIGLFLILGGDDRFWAHINKPMTVLFYIGTFLVVAFANTPMVQSLGDEVFETLAVPVSVAHRNIQSLGFTLRPLLSSGLLLGLWGLVGKDRGVWRFLQVSAPFALFGVDVGLFLFRSAGLSIVLTGVSYLVLRPFLERRARAGKSILVLAIATVGITIFASTVTSGYLLDRMSGQTGEGGMFESRNAEVGAYLDQAGWGGLFGRGLGGVFDASTVYAQAGEVYNRESFGKWGTMHYGILVFFLKGGIVMLALFVSILIPGFRRRSRLWYRNPINLTAALMTPISVLLVITDPVTLTVESMLPMLVLMGPLSRFGRRKTLDVGRTEVYRTNSERKWA